MLAYILNNSAALLTFLVLNLNGMKTLMGFLRQHAGFCRTQKLKFLSLVISRPVRFVCVQNTSSSYVLGRPTWEAWAPQLECLGARRAPWNFYSGDQLWGLGALTKMLGSPKGSLWFSLEHSLGFHYPNSLFPSPHVKNNFKKLWQCCTYGLPAFNDWLANRLCLWTTKGLTWRVLWSTHLIMLLSLPPAIMLSGPCHWAQ